MKIEELISKQGITQSDDTIISELKKHRNTLLGNDWYKYRLYHRTVRYITPGSGAPNLYCFPSKYKGFRLF